LSFLWKEAGNVMKADTVINDANDVKILVVEDDLPTQKITGKFLNRVGCTFDFVSTGKKALSADLHKYHLIFLDIRLPDMSGYEVAQKIREKESLQNPHLRIPIIAYTACGEIVKEKCMAAGVDDFIFKPATVEDFKRVIQRFVFTR
jgi:CheY-like chemotaxis protein